MDDLDHVMLTRFNLPTGGVEGSIRARDGWLRKRLQLFERFCAPSIDRQTRPVTWIIYFDPHSPSWLWDRLQPLIDHGLFRPVLRETVSEEEVRSDIIKTVGIPGKWLVTSNIDNDDALATDFSERLRSVRADRFPTAVYLTQGLIKSPDGVYRRKDRRNAFCSVIASWENPVTAWSEYHNELSRVMPTIEVDGPPAWLQVVHDNNVSNRVRGRLASSIAFEERFPGAFEGIADPSSRAQLVDSLLSRPARSVRDSSRAAARVAALRILGKERYQSLKLTLSRASSLVR